jgi:Na+/phosphate symporter
MMEGHATRPMGDAEMLALVRSRARRFDRQIRRRDWIELGAGAVGAVAIAPAIVYGALVTRLGALVVLVGLVVIAVRLRRARAVGRPAGTTDAALPVASALRAERQRVDAQIALLESVLGWYVAPLVIGCFLIVAGNQGASWFTLGYTIFLALLAWGIVALNARVVRRTLRPMRDRLSAQMAELEK